MTDYATYRAGLRLAGRRVVVVGGGHVAQRRVPTLLAVGAEVTVVSPVVTPAIEGLGDEITLVLRGYRSGDLGGAWYVIAATDDREVNELVSAEAEAQHTFCVRSDDATRATSWTPAVGRHDIVNHHGVARGSGPAHGHEFFFRTKSWIDREADPVKVAVNCPCNVLATNTARQLHWAGMYALDAYCRQRAPQLLIA